MPHNRVPKRHKASPLGCLTAHVCHKGRQDDFGDLCFAGKTNTDRGWEGSIRCPKSLADQVLGSLDPARPLLIPRDLLSESPS